MAHPFDMTRSMLSLAVVLAVLGGRCWTQAAEIRLNRHAAPAGAMTTLGDLADVIAAAAGEAERLRKLELFPSPPPGRERFVRARELHDLLILRGVNLAEHRFTGASQIVVAGTAPAAAPGQPATTAAHARRAHARITEALKSYLGSRVAVETPWLIDLELPEALVQALADPATELRVAGGQAPWVGVQHFQLSLTTPEGPQQADLAARVSIPASIVVASRSLPRGILLRPDDVELRHAGTAEEHPNALYSLEQAIGRETSRAVAAGRILTTDAVQAPVYVRRGEIVTVYAHAAGIRIRTQGRARDEGSEGMLVAVESLDTREVFFARVCGVREVEVFARAARAADSSGPLGAIR